MPPPVFRPAYGPDLDKGTLLSQFFARNVKAHSMTINTNGTSKVMLYISKSRVGVSLVEDTIEYVSWPI